MAAKKPKRTVLDVLRDKQSPRNQLTIEQLEQVQAAVEYNDAEPNPKKRLSSKDVCELLKTEYGFRHERCTLERLACAALGRRSWSCK
jgi:hypothetical protein